MKYRTLESIIREGAAKRASEYKSLSNAARSIYNRQITPQVGEPSEQELQQIQNRKAQVKTKIIDNP